jgi:hypothetical protein
VEQRGLISEVNRYIICSCYFNNIVHGDADNFLLMFLLNVEFGFFKGKVE